MNLFGDHLLSVITFTPLVGAVLLMAIPAFKRSDDAVRWVANIFGVLGFLVSLPLWFRFDRAAPGFQFIEKSPWIPTIGVSYHFGVDGISALLILLTTLLGAIAILCSWTAIHDRVRQYYVDEIYGALFVRGLALGGGKTLHGIDRYVVDGGDGEVRPGLGVNGIAWFVREGFAKSSDFFDRWFVDGAVNLTAAILDNLSYVFRSLQNGLVQHYALSMLIIILFMIGIGSRFIL